MASEIDKTEPPGTDLTGAQRFGQLWQQTATEIGLPPSVAERLHDELATRYREQHRSYHTLGHVVAVIDNLEALGERSVVARLSAFFHDAIYDPQASDNEERSADLATAWLPGYDDIDHVVANVLATQQHALPDNAHATCAPFLDADLAILGADPTTYETYRQAIAHEYQHLAVADFRTGRARVLTTFLSRPVLFFSEAGRERWEATARNNLAGEIEQLTS